MLSNEKKLDLRVKRTRRLIQQAFGELIAEKGFQNVSVQDITERAQVNRATFYLHYEDKYALLRSSVREKLQVVIDEHLHGVDTLTVANLRLLLVTIGKFMQGFFGTCHPATRTPEQIFMVSQVQEHTYELLQTWLRNTPTRVNPHSEHVALTLSWVIFGTVFQSQVVDKSQTLEEWADHVVTVLDMGLHEYLSEPALATH